MNSYSKHRRVAVTMLLAGGLTLASGCHESITDALLTATDPDIINPANVNSPEGAEGLRLGVVYRLTTMTGAAPANTEGVWFMGGMLADEWKSGDTFIQRDETDKRTIALDNSIVTAGYRYIHQTRIAANQAIDALRKYPPSSTATANAYIAQMQFIRAYADLLSADNFCNGQPFSDGSTGDIVEGDPLTVEQAFQRAIVSADSAIGTIGSATDELSKSILNGTQIVKARALLGVGGQANYTAAKAAVASVPTSYTYNVFFSANTRSNGIWSLNNSARRYVVGDSVDATGIIKNAIPFKSAKDPRVPTVTNATDKSVAKTAFDSNTPFVAQKIWLSAGSPPGSEDPIAVVNGIDARLIESEVALSQNDLTGWLSILNALRAGPTKISDGLTVSGMTPLVAPATDSGRVSLQFREKAFWTFGRGERLGDMRRLVRQYQRPANEVFPTGTFFKGGDYGTDVNLPVPQAEQNNSKFTGCTDREA